MKISGFAFLYRIIYNLYRRIYTLFKKKYLKLCEIYVIIQSNIYIMESVYMAEDIKMLLKELEVSKMIHKQIAKLNSISDMKKSINEVLASIGDYLGADRAYIFEESNNYYSNTFEWCAEGITSEIDTLQDIPADDIFYWVETLEKGECVVVGNIEDIRHSSPFVYETLARQNIRSAVEAPIALGNRLMGFIGVDNASEEMTMIVKESLMLLGSFIATVMQNSEEHEKILKSHADITNRRDMQREILNSINCGVFAYTIPEYKILVINDEAKRIMSCENNYKSTEAIMQFLEKRVFPDDRSIMFSAEKQLNNPGDSADLTYRALRDGGIINVRSSVKMLEFANGQKYILCTLLDITEQELMEKKLDEERRQYRNALALGSKTFFAVNLENDIIENPVFSSNGENLTEALGIITPTSYDDFAAAWFSDKRIIYDNESDVATVRHRDKLIEACNKGTSIIDFEYYVPSTKKYHRILVILYKINGNVHASFVIYDITSDKSEDKKRSNIIEVFLKIYSCIYLLSYDEGEYTVLKKKDDILQHLSDNGNLDDFIRIYTSKFVEPEFSDKVADFLKFENVNNSLADSDYNTLEFRRTNLGWCRASLISAGRDKNGNVTTAIFAMNVIEKQKEAELAQQEALKAAYESANIANSAKTDFLSNMSHDIRTPMNAIIGLTAIAGTHMDDRERLADCLTKITISSKHLLGIINEVLDMSKIESGKMELQEDEFNLPELIDNLLIMSKPEINAKNHDLCVSIKNIEHENVIGDSQRIQQVFMNIMSNAIKYTQNGGKISLTISEKPTNKHKVGCYEFIFEDNGIGMSEEFQKHIFEPFERARNDKRIDKIQGTGLGMPITKNIVQMMNGTIDVKSKLNEGTKIKITFFLRLRSDEEIVDCAKFIDLPVLVVDDDKVSCIYTCELLKEIGMDGEWVLTGREAVERVVEHNKNDDDFFAVIIDWRMPEMDGVQTTREIRKSVGNQIPIIIISAYDWSDIELEARAAGANAFISKPLFKSRMVHLFNDLVCGEPEEHTASELEALSEEDFSGKRALLVEDNELNAEIAGEILDMAGLTVEFASDGKQAVDIMSNVEDGYFDIIFMDIQMPIMNGYQASRAIRSLSRNYTKSVPIIAMTANAFAEDVAMAKNAGMNEHIAKPLDFNQLLKALQKWL